MFDGLIGVVKAKVPMVGVTHDDPVGGLCIIGVMRVTERLIPKFAIPVGLANCHCGSN